MPTHSNRNDSGKVLKDLLHGNRKESTIDPEVDANGLNHRINTERKEMLS